MVARCESIAAIQRGRTFKVLDWRTGRWKTYAAKGEWIGSPAWSADSKYVYFWALYHRQSEPGGIYRVRMGDGQVDPVVAFKAARLVFGVQSVWLGLGPDDAPMILRDESSQDIYALRIGPE